VAAGHPTLVQAVVSSCQERLGNSLPRRSRRRSVRLRDTLRTGRVSLPHDGLSPSYGSPYCFGECRDAGGMQTVPGFLRQPTSPAHGGGSPLTEGYPYLPADLLRSKRGRSRDSMFPVKWRLVRRVTMDDLSVHKSLVKTPSRFANATPPHTGGLRCVASFHWSTGVRDAHWRA